MFAPPGFNHVPTASALILIILKGVEIQGKCKVPGKNSNTVKEVS